MQTTTPMSSLDLISPLVILWEWNTEDYDFELVSYFHKTIVDNITCIYHVSPVLLKTINAKKTFLRVCCTITYYVGTYTTYTCTK